MAELDRHFLETLRHSASGEPTDFTRVLQCALIHDFAVTLDYVKTQKLVLKTRSSRWIATHRELMEAWLACAPLNGKKRSQVRRHLAICAAIQELLEAIDCKPSNLRIWGARTEDLLKKLFSFIEQRRFEEEEKRLERAKSATGPGTQIMKSAEFDRRDLRRFCDYVSLILNQIPRTGTVQSSDITLLDSDVHEALKLAAVTDLVPHIQVLCEQRRSK